MTVNHTGLVPKDPNFAGRKIRVYNKKTGKHKDVFTIDAREYVRSGNWTSNPALLSPELRNQVDSKSQAEIIAEAEAEDMRIAGISTERTLEDDMNVDPRAHAAGLPANGAAAGEPALEPVKTEAIPAPDGTGVPVDNEGVGTGDKPWGPEDGNTEDAIVVT